MLEIISGRAGSGKTACCLERIKNELVSEPTGRGIILLLPEHMTYKVERRLASMLAEEGRGFSRCYVYGFRRFAYRVLQETGGGLEQGLTELGRQLLLKQLLDKRSREQSLTAFAGAARQRGFVSELSDIINELKSYSISPELLQQLALQLGEQDTRLQDKLQDMAALYQDFNGALTGKYHDSKDILCRLIERLPQSELVRGAELWLDGFLFFNPLEQQLLTQLAEQCSEVHAVLTLDNSFLTEGRPCLEVPGEDIFYRSHSTRNYLLSLAESKGMAVRELFLSRSRRFASTVLQQMEEQWLSHHVRPVGRAEGIRFTEAATVRLELEAAAADIVRQVREQGYKWSDIGILIRDEESYGFLSELILREYHIPFFNAAKRQGTHHPLAELLRSALAVCSSRQGWSYENVFRCLKTGFFKVPCNLLPDALDALENYVLEFGIRGKKLWTQEAAWQFVRGKGMDEVQADEGELLRAAMADGWRRQAAAPLVKLQSALQKGKAASDLAGALYDFLTELQVPQQLESWAKEDELGGNLAAAREHQQIWAGIMDLLDQMVELGVQSQENLLTEFAAVLQEGLDTLTISLIPPGLDYVSLASFDQNSLDNLRAIYIVGANAGIMPRHSSENVILSDADRIRINQSGAMSRLPEDGLTDRRLSVIGRENSYNEAYLLYKGFTRAREYLWVSYALSDDSGAGREPARLVKWLRELAPGAGLWQVLQGDSFVAAASQALGGLGSALRECRDYGRLADKWQAVYNWLLAGQAEPQKAQKLGRRLKGMQRALGSRLGADRLPPELSERLFAPKGYIRGSVTRMECYNSCPFQYYARYGLKLEERKIRRFSNPELGTLLHAVLREFGERLQKERRRWCEVTEAQQRAMCHEILHRLAGRLENSILLQQKQLEVQLRRIENTANFALQRLCAFDAVSALQPSYFEKAFGGLAESSNDMAVELVYRLSNHKGLSLSGQIDRIDVTEDGNYFMVLDYKTGSASINIMDVYYGIRLQLLTYILVAGQLLSRELGHGSLPVGMLYCFLKRPMVGLANHQASRAEVIGALEDKLKMPGWIVADKELVQLIDSTLAVPGGKSRFVHVGVNKTDGELAKSAACLRTERELELLLAYVEQLLQRTGERMLAGEIQPEPYRSREGNTGCGYCPYRVICGFDAQLEGFGYKRVLQQKDIDFMQDIESELTPEQVRGIDDRLSGRSEQQEVVE
ncbi:MAG: PD-(D/E)XK nuclease family protein [Anaerovibrio sp.]|nr:PD-(D/E)XK nuclease family protein [Anaerovibrio sp.]